MAATDARGALSPRLPTSRKLLTLNNREWVAGLSLPAAAREQLTIALELIDAIDIQSARRCRAACLCPQAARLSDADRSDLRDRGLASVTILAELGDARRFQNSRDAVRYSGLDITVHQSDARRSPGHLSRQGPSALRWALYEAAQAARRPEQPDREYYLTTAERIGGNRACIAIARKLLKRCYHLLPVSATRPRCPVAS